MCDKANLKQTSILEMMMKIIHLLL